ncbi:MAG: nitric oxide dioxygenase [Acinetobacter sp. GWC1_38_13]|jgi:nitric oxide dioxygenase|uniref:Flavohemoprotein n=1 Tax=Acinetobacter junii TaxID=40215 RepID=A0A365PGY9_ACIJU|nr:MULTISPECIES: NO-inducible flavohemoprotein [Acinetobacter]MCU4396752.1 NO-inducible flavohemoprotein [Acinetobacter junii]MDA3501116.1 NO-inducible flavohemoprotein [Acinetobacter sp. AOR34_HL]MDI9720574.1 NO-inducible flavohemoprotein [Acinetobacter junii]MDR7654353.1 NO-inducible flavohemoprotein [Acinetobacter junii]OFW42582.1 MAG: nitric oxide dioxygenase [Acinetobacter sp. GWC1_38_13]
MTPQQIELVKATVPVLRENGVALTGYFYNRMLGNNPALKETFNMGHQRSGAQAQALAGAVLAYAENIEDPSVLLPVVELIAHKHVSLNIQAPDYSIVGENLLHSISEVLNISMEDPLIAAWAAAYGQLADLFISTEKAIYDQHQQTKGSWLGWRNFKIAKKVVESDEITSFYLAPVDGGDLPNYEAGQYISVRVFVPELNLRQPRQYTLSTSPQADYLRISVKREDAKGELAEGWVSNTLHSLAEGSEIEVSAPTGNFYLIDSKKRNVFISGGVGLTPMIAMLNQLVTLDMPQPVTFIHACRSSQVHAMKQHIHDLKAKFPRLSTFTAYEFPHDGDVFGVDYEAAGRLDLASMDAALLPTTADYYLCGPMPFMAEQHKALVARGIPAENIHSEAFGTGGVKLS